MMGYNIFGFDCEFLFKRAKICRAMKFYDLGRLRDKPSEMITKRLSSGALGDNILKMLPMPGRYTFDLFHEIKREKKLDSYSLNNVSKQFLGDTKIDMPAHEMFRRYREENAKELGEVAEYCLKDTLLPHRLVDKLCIFTNLVEMAKATWVPLSWLSERAQQIKVFSQITRKARELNFLAPTIKHSYGTNNDDKYEGATVLEAHTGAYYTPITALDFASLYPSIMVAHNLCFSTLVMNPAYLNIPGVEYESFEVSEGKVYHFAQNVPSLLPEILTELKQFRKKAKKLMAQARGTPMEEVYNGQQLAYKVSMNSIYGFCGAKRGILPCVPIAASVTSQGRNMIGMTKKCVEENFPGAYVRYGDSVTGDTPVLVRYKGKEVDVMSIESLGISWISMDDGKESCELSDWESWTDEGWTAIKRIIRHKTDKRIFRVSCDGGTVDCTEDHSLLRPDGSALKPTDCIVGEKLMIKNLPRISFDITDINGKVDAMKYFITQQSSGLNAYIDDENRVSVSLTPHGCNGIIKKIELLGTTTDYVYDLTTDNHHFHAGVGGMIVHNTDSVMVEFDCKGMDRDAAIRHSWKLGEEAAEMCNKMFKKPNDLELEKVYCPYILYSKKRYAAKMWTQNKSGEMEMEKVDVKGLQLVRRDNTPYTREVCKEVLNKILDSKDPKPGIDVAKQMAQELLDGNVPLDKLLMSKTLADSYKTKNGEWSYKYMMDGRVQEVPSQPHVQVLEKINKRTPGAHPHTGDRVPFVLVKTDDPKAKLFEKAEDPKYVKENNIPLDYNYYFTNQLKKPVEDLLEPLIGSEDIFATMMPPKPPRKKRTPKSKNISEMFKNYEQKVDK